MTPDKYLLLISTIYVVVGMLDIFVFEFGLAEWAPMAYCFVLSLPLWFPPVSRWVGIRPFWFWK
jgi:hypothetical protein